MNETCPVDLSIMKGEDRVHDFTFLRVTDQSTNPETTTPVVLTDASITMTIKRSLHDSDSEAIVQKTTTGGGVVIADAASGEFYCKVLKEDLDGMEHGEYWYDVQVTLGVAAGSYEAGSVLTPVSGAYEYKPHDDSRLSFVREDTNMFVLNVDVVTDSTTNPVTKSDVDLTDATFEFVAKERVDDSGSVLGDPTVTVTDAPGGQLRCVFDPEDTEDVDFRGDEKRELYFWLYVTLGVQTHRYSAGDVLAAISGIMTIKIDRTVT